MIGRRLSHFSILDRIGEGGMGVLYRARDERLPRVAAVKVLPHHDILRLEIPVDDLRRVGAGEPLRNFGGDPDSVLTGWST